MSGKCDWVWYHAKCLGYDTSVSIKVSTELPVATRHSHDMNEILLKTLNPNNNNNNNLMSYFVFVFLSLLVSRAGCGNFHVAFILFSEAQNEVGFYQIK